MMFVGELVSHWLLRLRTSVSGVLSVFHCQDPQFGDSSSSDGSQPAIGSIYTPAELTVAIQRK